MREELLTLLLYHLFIFIYNIDIYQVLMSYLMCRVTSKVATFLSLYALVTPVVCVRDILGTLHTVVGHEFESRP